MGLIGVTISCFGTVTVFSVRQRIVVLRYVEMIETHWIPCPRCTGSARAGGQEHSRPGREHSTDLTADGFSKDVGTELYIAPEVRVGQQYGSKVDLFAVGICIVELWSHFETEMERIQTLMHARDGILPEHMMNQHPMATKLATALLQKDPMLRPGAAEVCSLLGEPKTLLVQL